MVLPNLSAALSVLIDKDFKYRHLGTDVYYLEDSGSRLDVQQAMQESDWLEFQGREINFGFSESTYWLRFTIENRLPSPADLLLVNQFPLLDFLNVYVVEEGKILEEFVQGDSRPALSRSVFHSHFIFPIQVKEKQAVSVVIRVQSETGLQLPLMLWDKQSYISGDHFRSIAMGLFLGLLVAMSLYHILVFLSLKERSFLYYALLNLGLLCAYLSLSGLLGALTNAGHKSLGDNFLLASISVSTAFALLFVNSILQVPESYPRAARLLNYLAVIALIAAGSCLFMSHSQIAVPVLSLAGASMVPMVYIQVRRLLDGYSIAKYVLAASVFAAAGFTISVTSNIGVIPNSLLSEAAAYIGVVIMTMLDAFALSHRVNIERRLRQLAQTQLIESQNKLNQKLDDQVRARTAELEQANERLKELSRVDGLTQIYNRRYFTELYRREFRRAVRDASPLSLMLMDIDHFKNINDTYGHPFGDLCLKNAAHTILTSIRRPPDIAARYGGEEFIVLLPSTDNEGARHVANNILTAFNSTPNEDKGVSIIVTVSVGVATLVPDQNSSMETLLKAADELLYQAKHNGRNRLESDTLQLQ